MMYTYLGTIFSFLILVGTHIFNPIKSIHYQRDLISPPPALKYMHFGFNEVMADILWLRALQDFDYCESQIAKNVCKGNSWLYKMLDTTLSLSPHFRMPAVTGGIALSVLISDMEGASKFFDKALVSFPNDWQLLYYAAYHAIFEEKNKEKAAGYLIRSARNGGNDWFYSLAVRLYTEAGQRELGLSVYKNLKDLDFSPGLLNRMGEKLGLPKDQ